MEALDCLWTALTSRKAIRKASWTGCPREFLGWFLHTSFTEPPVCPQISSTQMLSLFVSFITEIPILRALHEPMVHRMSVGFGLMDLAGCLNGSVPLIMCANLSQLLSPKPIDIIDIIEGSDYCGGTAFRVFLHCKLQGSPAAAQGRFSIPRSFEFHHIPVFQNPPTQYLLRLIECVVDIGLVLIENFACKRTLKNV